MTGFAPSALGVFAAIALTAVTVGSLHTLAPDHCICPTSNLPFPKMTSGPTNTSS